MLFSDNVSLASEIALKSLAREKGLIQKFNPLPAYFPAARESQKFFYFAVRLP